MLRRKELYRGHIVTLYLDELEGPAGRQFRREVAESAQAVAMVAIDGDGQLLMVSQYRHAVGGDLLELPAGRLEPGEAPLAAAERELAEETGYRAGHWERLGSIYAAPGLLTEELHIFLATGLAPAVAEPDDDECLSLVKVAWQEALEAARGGAYRDAKTLVGLMWAAHRLGR